MIKSYQVEQNLNTTDGETADISFGLKATGVPVSIAHEIENEFSKFMGRVTGGSVTMTQATTRTLEWSPEELDSIRHCNTVAEARRKYRETFPDSCRSKVAIKSKFAELRKMPAKPDISAGSLPGEPAAVPAEIPKTPAAKTGPVKKPGKISNVGNFASGRWSDEEKTIVDAAADADAAWAAYHKKFPKSERNRNAIYQRWLKCHGTSSVNTSKQSAQAIPSSNEGKAPAKPARLPYKLKNQRPEAPPAEEQVTRYAGDDQPHTAVDEDPLDPPMQHDDTPETYTVQGLDQALADALPEEAPPTGHKEKAEAAKTMETIKIGDKVRQISGLRICAGIGEIKRAPPGNPEVLVAFGNGQEWINRKNLAPVMA